MSEVFTLTKETPPEAGSKTGRQGQLHEAIAALVKDLPRGTHLTAPEVYRRAKDSGLQVSLSTVYRTLNLLQAHGNVLALAGDHGKRYEASDLDHDHLICVKCGLTIEFTDDLIRGFGRAVAERKGYEHRSSRFDILGICQECKSKDEDHKIETAMTSAENGIALLQDVIANLEIGITNLESRKLAKAKEQIDFASPRLKEALDEITTALDALA